jgi:hypothetical protein
LSDVARAAIQKLDRAEAMRVADVIAELMDEAVPLVREGDISVVHGSSIVGRRVPTTDLAICYVSAGDTFFVVNVLRRAR